MSRQLRQMGLDQSSSVQALLGEALDLLFESRQLPTIAGQPDRGLIPDRMALVDPPAGAEAGGKSTSAALLGSLRSPRRTIGTAKRTLDAR